MHQYLLKLIYYSTHTSYNLFISFIITTQELYFNLYVNIYIHYASCKKGKTYLVWRARPRIWEYHHQAGRGCFTGGVFGVKSASNPQVWNHHLAPLNAVNCGIRGDITQNVMYLPAIVSVGVIHCGINDINAASSHDNVPHKIAENLILSGSKIKSTRPLMSIIIVGILSIEETLEGRKLSKIDKVNKILEESCQSHSFLFVEQARCWRDPSISEVNQSLYWHDGLHFKEEGLQHACKNLCR